MIVCAPDILNRAGFGRRGCGNNCKAAGFCAGDIGAGDASRGCALPREPATLPRAIPSGFPVESACMPIHSAGPFRAAGSMGHLTFDILMGFISFGSVAILIASFVALVIWILSRLLR
jgi:hypothetical protein